MRAAWHPRFVIALERPTGQGMGEMEEDSLRGRALARAAEAHPALEPLLDFLAADPGQIAREVGMVYPYEEDGADDLAEIDFGPAEWFEPAAGLAAVRRALEAVRADPDSIKAAVYDPGLRAADVIADLEALERALGSAQQAEARFHFRLAE